MSVLALNNYIAMISEKVFQTIAANTIQILFHLATNTDLFGVQLKRSCMIDRVILLAMSEDEDIQFIGGLLMQLFLIFAYHSCEVNIILIIYSRKANKKVYFLKNIIDFVFRLETLLVKLHTRM